MKNFIAGFIATHIFFYLLGVMFSGDFNASHWNDMGKISFILTVPILGIVAGVNVKEHYETIKENNI